MYVRMYVSVAPIFCSVRDSAVWDCQSNGFTS